MKHLTVYWKSSPEDLDVLAVVDHIRLGFEGEEVITTDQEADIIRAMSREFDDAFVVDSMDSLEPKKAAELVIQHLPGNSAKEPLQRLIGIVRKENPEAAAALTKELAYILT